MSLRPLSDVYQGSTEEGDAPVQSPCIRNCCLDEHEVCVGCGRSLQEIVGWNESDEARRREIVARAEQRRKMRQARFSSSD